jgi:hypothetical protein
MPRWVQERFLYLVISKAYTVATSQIDVDRAASQYGQVNIVAYSGDILARTMAYRQPCTDFGPTGTTGSDYDLASRCRAPYNVDSGGVREERRKEESWMGRRVHIGMV